MPPLTTARSWRRFGEIAALAGIAGALWGPVGSAEAGVSAGSTATPKPPTTITLKPSQAGSANVDGLLVGTGPGADQLQILSPKKAKRLGQQCSFTGYQTSFLTWLSNGFTSLAARSGPFTYCDPFPGVSPWTGGSFQVTAWTDSGTNICRGSTYQTASSRWYRTSRGWVWSGGTAAPAWNRNC